MTLQLNIKRNGVIIRESVNLKKTSRFTIIADNSTDLHYDERKLYVNNRTSGAKFITFDVSDPKALELDFDLDNFPVTRLEVPPKAKKRKETDEPASKDQEKKEPAKKKQKVEEASAAGNAIVVKAKKPEGQKKSKVAEVTIMSGIDANQKSAPGSLYQALGF